MKIPNQKITSLTLSQTPNYHNRTPWFSPRNPYPQFDILIFLWNIISPIIYIQEITYEKSLEKKRKRAKATEDEDTSCEFVLVSSIIRQTSRVYREETTYGYRSPLRGLIGFESSRLFDDVYACARAPSPRGSSSSSYDNVLQPSRYTDRNE